MSRHPVRPGSSRVGHDRSAGVRQAQGARRLTSHLEVVFFDIGGPLYGDRPYYEGLLSGIREVRSDASEDEFWAEFEACRRDQRGPFTQRLVGRFVDAADAERAIERGKAAWSYPPDSLQPDVREALGSLHGVYRLGVLANQERWIRETMARDRLDGYFEIWAISAEVGVDKPDPKIFEYALSQAGAAPERCVMVGDRLDNDISAAKRHGMRTVWLLRGEAPDQPTAEQLAVPDASVRSLIELPAALRSLNG
ncbi:MAG: HAD family hydrolase [Actinomycetota bacterium]